MSVQDLPLDVIGAQFAMLEPDRQRDTAFLCLNAVLREALDRGADGIAAAELDHMRSAVTTFEEGLYRRTIHQLEMAQAIAARLSAGGAFAAVGQRNAYRVAMLRRRLDLIRIITPVAADRIAS
ncbi:hypothetical protein GCM10007036_09940 [Alsobacter metallidurans]|uniref:Uncharacterized protein n=1 Tax=Alsobacter metallidurans TaxID=340221 RepID=A0A917MH16_9HYPH|nr:hypothetical protein [Alsobacter metallidurans]GGH12264.1 hypothetical protein GCM10007036_09940 [Alsobacter metallidurans]